MLLKLATIYCIAAKTLYHGTSLQRAKKIMDEGLIPQVGSWVSDSYGSELDFDNEEYSPYDENAPVYNLIFAADKVTIASAVGGIIAAIAADEGKRFHEVTNEDVRNKGAILVMYDAEKEWEQKPTKEPELSRWERRNNYPTVEPGDYYRTEDYLPNRLLSGEPMIRLLKKHHVFPIITDPASPEKFKKNLINYLFNRSNEPIESIIEKVNNMSSEEIRSAMYELRRG